MIAITLLLNWRAANKTIRELCNEILANWTETRRAQALSTLTVAVCFRVLSEICKVNA